jgi:putative heme-binding domain-containing protein
LRRRLEAYHGVNDAVAIKLAWPLLDHPDPWIAHAARVAVEHQPLEAWAARALAEPAPSKAVPALLALTRVAPETSMADTARRLAELSLEMLGAGATNGFVRAVAYAVQRSASLDPKTKARLISQLDSLVPNAQPEINREACRLLIQLDAPSAVEKSTDLLAAAREQEEKLHYLQILGSARSGWTAQNRARVLRGLVAMRTFRGGAGLPKYLKEITQAALATMPEGERARAVAMLEAAPAPASVPVTATPRPFVKHWSMEDFAAATAALRSSPNLARGKALFAAAQCVVCHRLGEDGGTIGPDLTDVASRFSTRDILESILEPSRVVSDTYRFVVVTTKDGKSITGRLAPVDYRLPVLRLAPNPLSDDHIDVPKDDIVFYAESEVSPMPGGLIDTLTREEIYDLLAYIEQPLERGN